jgi:two-component system, NarL family, invasion response regulator UvrY
MKITKLIIADDHQMLRKAWRLLLSKMENLTIIGEASNGMEVLDLLRQQHANVVLLDIDMPLMDGFETMQRIRKDFPYTRVVALSMFTDKAYAKKMLSLGASGYVTKNSSNDELFKAIEIVSAGGKFVCEEIQSMLLEEFDQEEQEEETLSKREVEIIKLIADGLSSKEISEKLFLSLKTIESHRGNIYKKLKVKNVAELLNKSKAKLII